MEMTDIIEKFVHEHMFMHIVLIALSVAAMLLAMTVDFSQAFTRRRRTAWRARRRD